MIGKHDYRANRRSDQWPVGIRAAKDEQPRALVLLFFLRDPHAVDSLRDDDGALADQARSGCRSRVSFDD